MQVCKLCGKSLPNKCFDFSIPKVCITAGFCYQCNSDLDLLHIRSSGRTKPVYDNLPSQQWTSIRRQFTQEVVLHYGGCCFCGETWAIDFHHLDPASKDFSISSIPWGKRDLLIPELEKCIITCKNCHHKIHCGVLSCDDKTTIVVPDHIKESLAALVASVVV